MTASLTDRYSYPGKQALLGARAWIEDTNSSGGIGLSYRKRIPVQLVYYDDESNPRRCEELTERLIIEDEVDVLIGPYSSGLARRAAAVARRHKCVMWTMATLLIWGFSCST